MTKVLIVDDEKSIRLTLQQFLLRNGYEADIAETAETAMDMIARNRYDVVVTDIIMPRITGIELLSFIRKISVTIQVVIMTGEPTVDTAIEAMHMGANAYLKKPVGKEDFLKTIYQVAQIKKLNDEKEKLQAENLLYQKDLEMLVAKKTKELQKAMQSTITLITMVVEIKDPYTAGHQRKVGNLSAAIAQKMGLGTSTISLIRITGYLHDIGKIVIPSEVLSKPGELSQAEMELIRNHPFLGYDLLNKVEFPPIISETIYQHHERCDGSGYPRGLTKDEISIESKIVMVADVLEAILSHRPYRPALGKEAAFDELRKNAGRLYDKDVVKACLELFEKDNYSIDDSAYQVYFPV